MPRLLLATTNRGKAAEYEALLKGLDFEMVTLDQVGINQAAPEDYSTFEENARSKAEFYSALSGLITLADDSGLEVDALNGEPGVRSSRYAGEDATDAQRVNFLLNKLRQVPLEKRTARFRCVIAVAVPGRQNCDFRRKMRRANRFAACRGKRLRLRSHLLPAGIP